MDRVDIIEAHAVLEIDYNIGGILIERPSNMRRNMSTSYQLSRMHVRLRSDLTFAALSDDAKHVYLSNVLAMKLPRDAEINIAIQRMFSEDWLRENHPDVVLARPVRAQ